MELSDPIFYSLCFVCFMKCGINSIHLKILTNTEMPSHWSVEYGANIQYGNGFTAHCVFHIQYTCINILEIVKSMIYVRWAWMCFVHLNCLFRFFNKIIFSIFSSFFLFSFGNFDFRYALCRNWNEYIEQTIKHFRNKLKNEIWTWFVCIYSTIEKNLICTYFISKLTKLLFSIAVHSIHAFAFIHIQSLSKIQRPIKPNEFHFVLCFFSSFFLLLKLHYYKRFRA